MAALPSNANHDSWPELPLEAWQDTYATLHMWTQIVGKVRLALSPRVNHWWEVRSLCQRAGTDDFCRFPTETGFSKFSSILSSTS